MDEASTIRNNIQKFIQLTDDEFEYFHDLLKIQNYQEGQNLLDYGSICDRAFLILTGCIRYFNVVDGEEITGQFFFENTWYSDYESYLFNAPSQQTIQAIESTRVAILTKDALDHLYSKIPKFERFGRLIAENAFLGVKARNNSFLNQTPEERYQALLKERPKVISRIPQHYIASYLGIKPESLSRIRKRMMDNS